MATVVVTTVRELVDKLNAFLRNASTYPEPRDLAKAATLYVRELCQPLYIGAYDDNHPGEFSFRICISSKQNKADHQYELAQAANGLLIIVNLHQKQDGSARWRADRLVMPSSDLRTNYNIANVAKNVGYYNVYPITDGTTVTLYHYCGKWVFSSRNCVEIDTAVWRDFTYRKVIDHALKQYPFDYNDLNTSCSYTIGFRHPAFHQFGQPAEFTDAHFSGAKIVPDVPPKSAAVLRWKIAVWLISTTDSRAQPNSTGICTISGLATSALVPAKNLEQMQRENDSAVATWKAGGPEHFGFVLRSKARTITGADSFIMMRSSLMDGIRRSIYDIGKIKLNPTKAVSSSQYYRDLNFAIMIAYLNHGTRQYLELFPHFRKRQMRIVWRLEALSRMFLTKAGVKCEDKPVSINVRHSTEKIYDRICTEILADFKPTEGTTKILDDLLRSFKFAEVYYEEIFAKAIAANPYRASAMTFGDYFLRVVPPM